MAGKGIGGENRPIGLLLESAILLPVSSALGLSPEEGGQGSALGGLEKVCVNLAWSWPKQSLGLARSVFIFGGMGFYKVSESLNSCCLSTGPGTAERSWRLLRAAGGCVKIREIVGKWGKWHEKMGILLTEVRPFV